MAARRQDYQDRITVDPNILIGKPVITGTRIPVSLIFNLLAHGYDFDLIIEAYPVLTHEDIKAALLYAQARFDHRTAPPTPRPPLDSKYRTRSLGAARPTICEAFIHRGPMSGMSGSQDKHCRGHAE